MSIELQGFDELIKDIEEMQISDSERTKCLNECGDLIIDNIKNNPKAPNVTGRTKESIKKSVKSNELTVTLGVNWGGDEEWGSSKNRKYVGFFENGVEDSSDKIEEAVKKLIDKWK